MGYLMIAGGLFAWLGAIQARSVFTVQFCAKWSKNVGPPGRPTFDSSLSGLGLGRVYKSSKGANWVAPLC
jgi:hypothetical protein